MKRQLPEWQVVITCGALLATAGCICSIISDDARWLLSGFVLLAFCLCVAVIVADQED